MKPNYKIEKNYDENGTLRTDTRGLSTVEYLILLVVIAVAGISIWTKVGSAITDKAGISKDAINTL